MFVLADTITISIGENIWRIDESWIVYVLIAAIVGIIAEFIVGWRMPLGILGDVVAGLVGIWLMTRVIVISGIPDYDLYGVPLVRALIGAIIFVAIWQFLTAGYGRRRRVRAVA